MGWTKKLGLIAAGVVGSVCVAWLVYQGGIDWLRGTPTGAANRFLSQVSSGKGEAAYRALAGSLRDELTSEQFLEQVEASGLDRHVAAYWDRATSDDNGFDLEGDVILRHGGVARVRIRLVRENAGLCVEKFAATGSRSSPDDTNDTNESAEQLPPEPPSRSDDAGDAAATDDAGEVLASAAHEFDSSPDDGQDRPGSAEDDDVGDTRADGSEFDPSAVPDVARRPPEVEVLERLVIDAIARWEPDGSDTAGPDTGDRTDRPGSRLPRSAEIREIRLRRLKPQFLDPPEIDRAGMLNLHGRFSVSRVEIDFYLSFADENGRWVPHGVRLLSRFGPEIAAEDLLRTIRERGAGEALAKTHQALRDRVTVADFQEFVRFLSLDNGVSVAWLDSKLDSDVATLTGRIELDDGRQVDLHFKLARVADSWRVFRIERAGN